MEKTKTSVYVGGREYTLVSSDSSEYMQRVAAYTDRALREMTIATHLPAVQSNVLAAINLADELLKAQDEITRRRARVRDLEEELLSLKGEV